MNIIGPEILSGIIAGIIATAIIVFLRQIGLKIIRPWWEDFLYDDARIEGTWKSKTDYSGYVEIEVWKLEQIGHSIKGTVTVMQGDDQGKTYTIEGKFKNLILTGIYTSTDKSAIDRGTINLMLVNNGHTLTGHGTYYYDPDHIIKTINYTWQKEQKA